MSLINDALKRARQQAPEEAPPSAALDPAMTPAAHAPWTPQWPVVVVPLLLVGVIGVAAWFFWTASSSMGLSARALGGRTVAAREEPAGSLPLDSNAPAATAVASATPATSVPPRSHAATTNAAPAPVAVAAAVPVATPAAPTLKLQAIFYRVNNPTAIISTKSVVRGDTIHGARVLRIDRESVTLWANGRTNVLTLP